MVYIMVLLFAMGLSLFFAVPFVFMEICMDRNARIAETNGIKNSPMLFQVMPLNCAGFH